MRRQKWGQHGQEGSQGAPAVSLARGRAGRTHRCVLGQTDVRWDRHAAVHVKSNPSLGTSILMTQDIHVTLLSPAMRECSSQLTPATTALGRGEVSVPSGDLFLFPMGGNIR